MGWWHIPFIPALRKFRSQTTHPSRRTVLMSCSGSLVKQSSKTHPKYLPNSPPQRKIRYPTVWGTIINIFTILHQILPGIFHDIQSPEPLCSRSSITWLKGGNLKIASRSISMHIHNTSCSCVCILIYLFICLFIYLFIYLLIYWFIYLFIH